MDVLVREHVDHKCNQACQNPQCVLVAQTQKRLIK